jgi:hypothetical protein
MVSQEDSPTFLLLCKFCASQMFDLFVKGRIDDMGMTSRDRLVLRLCFHRNVAACFDLYPHSFILSRSSIFPHHIPLFDVCSKYLLINRLEFSLMNIRRIVSAVSNIHKLKYPLSDPFLMFFIINVIRLS